MAKCKGLQVDAADDNEAKRYCDIVEFGRGNVMSIERTFGKGKGWEDEL